MPGAERRFYAARFSLGARGSDVRTDVASKLIADVVQLQWMVGINIALNAIILGRLFIGCA